MLKSRVKDIIVFIITIIHWLLGAIMIFFGYKHHGEHHCGGQSDIPRFLLINGAVFLILSFFIGIKCSRITQNVCAELFCVEKGRQWRNTWSGLICLSVLNPLIPLICLVIGTVTFTAGMVMIFGVSPSAEIGEDEFCHPNIFYVSVVTFSIFWFEIIVGTCFALGACCFSGFIEKKKRKRESSETDGES